LEKLRVEAVIISTGEMNKNYIGYSTKVSEFT
jgi:hypothetical protein